MLTLAPTTTLQGVAEVASAVTLTVFGMERTIATGVEAYKVLYQGQLPSSTGVLYTVPNGTEAMIKSMFAVNLHQGDNFFGLFYNGTAAANRILPNTTLRPHGMATYNSNGWDTMGVRGGVLRQNSTTLQDANYSSMHAETLDRNFCTEANQAALVSGRLTLQAIWLTAGHVVRWISFHSATTAGATLTNQLFGLYRVSDRVLLAVTVNDGATAWAANAIKTLRVTTPYTVPTTGLYYLGVMVAATTVPTLKGNLAATGGQLRAAAPILQGTSTTGLTTTLPNPAAALTATLVSVWGAAS